MPLNIPMKADDQIVRVDMDVLEIQGRKSNLPAAMKSEGAISHVPSAGSNPGSK